MRADVVHGRGADWGQRPEKPLFTEERALHGPLLGDRRVPRLSARRRRLAALSLGHSDVGLGQQNSHSTDDEPLLLSAAVAVVRGFQANRSSSAANRNSAPPILAIFFEQTLVQINDLIFVVKPYHAFVVCSMDVDTQRYSIVVTVIAILPFVINEVGRF
jgi:hypothetical protein